MVEDIREAVLPAETKKKIGLDGSMLKYIAIVTMLIDHIGAILVAPMVYGNVKAAEMNGILGLYSAMRSIGRVAFPIFCFFLVEGFFYTKDVKSYGKRLFLFALLSEIPFDMGFYGKIFYPKSQNVFFTLFIGLLVMAALEEAQKKLDARVALMLARVGIVAAGCLVSLLLATDYYVDGILSIAVLYLFRSKEHRTRQLLAGAITFLWEPYAIFAFPLLYFYNEKRGRQPKYLFYGFYPIHIIVLYGISLLPFFAG